MYGLTASDVTRRRPEIVGYLGANGSGKSTTVKIVTAMLKPSDGRILFQGRDILDDLPGYRAALGYVPEEAHVYTHLSGLEYLQLTLPTAASVGSGGA